MTDFDQAMRAVRKLRERAQASDDPRKAAFMEAHAMNLMRLAWMAQWDRDRPRNPLWDELETGAALSVRRSTP